jgi:hypothetical protein
MDERNDSSARRGAKRGAYSHIQHLSSSMNRGERLAVALRLIEAALNEVGQSSVRTELSVRGEETFNEKIEDIQVLAPNLSAKILVELTIDILTAELRN